MAPDLDDTLSLELESLIRRGHETPDVDVKGPGNWKTWVSAEKAELIRDMMAMANSDRPGWIIIGISEGAGGDWVYDGLTDAGMSSFDPSDIGKKAKRLADPEIRFSVHRPEVDGRRYIAIRVEPFQTMPHICVQSSGDVLAEGAIYVRSEACESTRVTRAEQMRRLVERAVQTHADKIVNQIGGLMARAGLTITPSQIPALPVGWDKQINEARRQADASGND